MQEDGRIFDRNLLRRRKARAAAGFAAYDFLWREAADRLADRLEDMTRRFPLALEIGSHQGILSDALKGRAGIERLIACALTPEMLASPGVAADEEWLPFAPESADAIFSLLGLHWVNDLPGALIQMRHILKPDGLLLASFFGGETLKELREAITAASIAEEGGISPRISPFVEVRDAGSLLQRAGFALPVVDSDTLTVSYENVFRLMDDLRGMGESNALLARLKHPSRRRTFAAIAEYYHSHFALEDGRIPATFELITLTAWKPHASQPKPAKRGSGKVSLKQTLEQEERSGELPDLI